MKKTRIEIDEQLVQALQKIVQRLDSIDGALNAPTPAFNEFNIGSTLNRDVQEAHHALQPEVAKENQIGTLHRRCEEIMGYQCELSQRISKVEETLGM